MGFFSDLNNKIKSGARYVYQKTKTAAHYTAQKTYALISHRGTQIANEASKQAATVTIAMYIFMFYFTDPGGLDQKRINQLQLAAALLSVVFAGIGGVAGAKKNTLLQAQEEALAKGAKVSEVKKSTFVRAYELANEAVGGLLPSAQIAYYVTTAITDSLLARYVLLSLGMTVGATFGVLANRKSVAFVKQVMHKMDPDNVLTRFDAEREDRPTRFLLRLGKARLLIPAWKLANRIYFMVTIVVSTNGRLPEFRNGGLWANAAGIVAGLMNLLAFLKFRRYSGKENQSAAMGGMDGANAVISLGDFTVSVLGLCGFTEMADDPTLGGVIWILIVFAMILAASGADQEYRNLKVKEALVLEHRKAKRASEIGVAPSDIEMQGESDTKSLIASASGAAATPFWSKGADADGPHVRISNAAFESTNVDDAPQAAAKP